MWIEIGHILKSYFLSAIPNSLELCYRIVNLSMLGYIGKGNLLAGGLGEAYAFALWCIIEGTLSAADELFHKFSGKQDEGACRSALFIACSCSMGICLVAMAVMMLSPIIVPIIFVGLSQAVSQKVVQYVYIMVPVLWVLCAFRMLEKYLYFQGVVRPIQAINAVGVVVSIIANYIFLYVLGLGFASCAVATLLARTTALILTILHFQAYDEFACVKAEGLIYLHKNHPGLCWLGAKVLKPIFLVIVTLWAQLHKRVLCPLIVQLSGIIAAHSSESGSAVVAVAPVSDSTDANADVEMVAFSTDSTKDGHNINDNEERVHLITTKSSSSQEEVNGKESKGDIRMEEGDELLVDSENEEDSLIAAPISRRRDRQTRPRSVVTHRLKNFCMGLLSRPALRYLVLALPSGLNMAIENWNCDLLPLIIACPLRTVATDSVVIVLLLSKLAYYCIGLPLSTALTHRIILSLESGSPSTARKSALVNLAAAFALSLLYGWLLYLSGEYLGGLFTYDVSVGYRIWKIEVIIPPLVVASTMAEVCKGILRAQHRQRQCAAFHLACTVFFSLTLSWYLAYFTEPQALLLGFWVGYTVGWGMLAVVMLMYVGFLIDWEREVRRAQLRMQLREQGEYHVFCLPRTGSISVGGFPFARRDMYNNVDDLESIEVDFHDDDVGEDDDEDDDDDQGEDER